MFSVRTRTLTAGRLKSGTCSIYAHNLATRSDHEAMRAPRRNSLHFGSDRRDSLVGDITHRRHSLFGNMIHLSSSVPNTRKRSSQLQKYMSERKAQLNPWTSFLRRENHEDDPVHICVCVCVCVCARVCVYSGLELGMCDTVW